MRVKVLVDRHGELQNKNGRISALEVNTHKSGNPVLIMVREEQPNISLIAYYALDIFPGALN